MNHHKDKKAARRTFNAIFVLSLYLCAFAVTVHAQSRTNQTIDQMIQALGGQAFLDVKDIHTTGRFFSFTRGELSGGDLFSDYIKFPDMERTEFGGIKNKTIQINRGKEGWKIEGKKDPETQTPGEVELFQKEFGKDLVKEIVLM